MLFRSLGRAPPFADLPARGGARPSAPQDPDSLALDFDLPAPAAARAPVASRAPAPARSPESYDLDLPTVGTRAEVGVGLPSVSARSPSPAFGVAGLPSPVAPRSVSPAPSRAPQRAASGSGFGEIELPSLAAGLPDVSRSGLPARNVGLPSLSGAGGSMGSTGFELDDDAFGSELPSPSRAPGGRSQANLPAVGGPMSDFGSTELPSLGAGLPSPSHAGLPAYGSSGLPSLGGSGLPSNPPGLPSSPPLEFDNAPPRVPSLPPDFGLSSGSAPPPVGRAHADFGELDLPVGDPPGAPPPIQRGPAFQQDDGEEADLFGEVPLPPRAPAQRAASTARAELDAAIVRQSGGGTNYGEVNLGDEDDSEASLPIEASDKGSARREEDMEFGAIPQEDQPRTEAAPAHTSLRVQRPLPEVTKAKRRSSLRIVAGLVVVFVGGAALALVPSLGPFGSYVIIDKLKASEYAQLVSNTVTNARAGLAKDTYPEAKAALDAIDAAHASAKRVRELPAYDAFTAYAAELRFGADPAIHARASVLLDELAEHGDEIGRAHV